jgi:hypothetical protein
MSTSSKHKIEFIRADGIVFIDDDPGVAQVMYREPSYSAPTGLRIFRRQKQVIRKAPWSVRACNLYTALIPCQEFKDVYVEVSS